MPEKILLFTKRAINRLEIIEEYISKNNQIAARKVVEQTLMSVEDLTHYPEQGRLGRISGTRERVLNNIPYIIVYRVTKNSIIILTILHTSQKWLKIL